MSTLIADLSNIDFIDKNLKQKTYLITLNNN